MSLMAESSSRLIFLRVIASGGEGSSLETFNLLTVFLFRFSLADWKDSEREESEGGWSALNKGLALELEPRARGDAAEENDLNGLSDKLE